MSVSLPPEVSLRRATSADLWPIRKLVFGAKLDPTQLRWQQFWLVERQGKIVACGQLRSFEKAQELGSLVVNPAYRNQGLGTALAEHLIREAIAPLYLECLGLKLAQFYRRLGFTPVAWAELPAPLKVKFGLSQVARKVLKVPVEIMKYSDRPNC